LFVANSASLSARIVLPELMTFLGAHGVEAQLHTGTPPEVGYDHPQMSYDKLGQPNTQHSLVVATTPAGRFTLDLTASQYGFREFRSYSAKLPTAAGSPTSS